MQHTTEIKHRMKSIKDTRHITKAMQLISAAKLKKARQQLNNTLPYFEKVKVTMADILTHSGDMENKFFDIRHEKKGKKTGYIIFTGDKGLAGSYNHNIIRTAENELEKKPDARLFVVGNVGQSYFLKQERNMDTDFDFPVNNPTVFRAREISEYLLELFSRGEIDELFIVYTLMVTTLNLKPRVMKLLPLDPEELKKDLGIKDKSHVEVEKTLMYEPSPEDVFNILIPKYLKGIIYGTLVEAFTSEQSSRMTSMQSATENADDMINELKMQFNRARQALITQEISEIVGGAQSLDTNKH